MQIIQSPEDAPGKMKVIFWSLQDTLEETEATHLKEYKIVLEEAEEAYPEQ